jgi:hypothetical protein
VSNSRYVAPGFMLRNRVGAASSVESSAWQNGAFTKAIVEGIQQGKADLLGKGTITTSQLDAFLENRVQELTEGKQHTVMGRPPEEPDFTIPGAQAMKAIFPNITAITEESGALPLRNLHHKTSLQARPQKVAHLIKRQSFHLEHRLEL